MTGGHAAPYRARVAYDQDLAQRVRALLGREAAAERRMFGGLAFLVDGQMCVAVSGSGGLMVRVDPAQAAGLLEEPGTGPVVMRGAPVTGWLLVQPGPLEDDAALATWVRRGLDRARSLPPGR